MLRRRIILILLFLISLMSTGSFVLLLQYFDPYINPLLALVFLSVSFVFGLTSFLTLLVYFFKKIYYRGEVRIYHIFSSLRQSFFMIVFILSAIVLIAFEIPYPIPLILAGLILLFIELFIQSL